MFITSVNLPLKETQHRGLEPIHMKKLGQLVVLAGKNGSGKSRILDLIFETHIGRPLEELKIRTVASLEQNKARLEKYKIASLSLSDDAKDRNFREIQNLEKKISEQNRTIDWNFLETSQNTEPFTAVQFVPQPQSLTNPSELAPSLMIRFANEIGELGVHDIYQKVLAKLQYAQNQYFEATHPQFRGSSEEKIKAEQEYKELEKIVFTFLGTELGRGLDGQAHIFGFPLGNAKLSKGQNILLQFCLALHSQKAKLDDMILMMDEPENHLHPDAIIALLERLREVNTKGQIWIATHSIPLIAHFGPDVVWFVDRGKVSYGGRIPEIVLTSLLGVEEEIEKVRDFLSLPFQFATSRHAFESLFISDAVLTDTNDPQSGQVQKALQDLSEKDMIKVLDYGVGKGRTLANIFDYERSEQLFSEKVNYVAFDEYDTDKIHCCKVIERVYGSSNKRYYNKMTTLLSEHDAESFDAVIMCNVLHEIDPIEWLKLFEKSGTVSQLLKPSGRLILMEDTKMPTGERAFLNGFIVLDTPEIKHLFQISSNEDDFIVREGKDGRLKCHLIPAKYISNITASTRVESLEMASKRTRDEILYTRKKTTHDYKDGKYHGFVTQQYANINLCLAQLKGAT